MSLKEAIGGKDVKAASLKDTASDNIEEKEGEEEKEQRRKKKVGFRDRRVRHEMLKSGLFGFNFNINFNLAVEILKYLWDFSLIFTINIAIIDG